MTKQKESSDQGIRKTEQDSEQPIKQKIRWIPNNSGPRKKKGQRNRIWGKSGLMAEIPENDGPSSSSTKNSEVLNSTSEFHPSPLLPLFRRKTIKDTNYNFFTKGSEKKHTS